ncbi:hypothetical protein L0F63_000114 [Massospora cicadina]|nr:hypothetical protein L0F63_000114 [Massospora cicadina]
MGKPENFQFGFANEKPVFYAGQVIEGKLDPAESHIQFRFLHPERAKSLTVFFIGSETTFSGPAGTKRNSEETEIFKSYLFPFKVDLGAYNFPSSYEVRLLFQGEYGNIRYKFKAVIDRPSRFGHSTSFPITLLSAIISTYGMVTRETLKLLVETKSRSCCPGGKLILDVSFLPLGSKSITGLEIKLMQEVKVIFQSKTSVSTNVITTFTMPLQANCRFDDDQDLVRLTVPSTTPPTTSSSLRITIDYYLLVTAAVSWPYTPLVVKIPVQISTLNVTMDEIPPLASGHHYMPPVIHPGQLVVQDEGDVASAMPYSSRHSLTPSLISDVSSLYSQDSDEFDSRRRLMFQPNYSPVVCLPPTPSSPRAILS